MTNLVKATQYTEEFNWMWSRRPLRHSPDNKKSAYKQWNTRLKQGRTEKDMTIGVMNYGKHMVSLGYIGTNSVKMMQTFFGPDEHFMNYQEQVAEKIAQGKPEKTKQVPLREQLTDTSWAF